MTREELKEELLNDEEQQFKTTVAAQFVSLLQHLITKGLFTTEDIDAVNKLTDEYAKAINEKSVDKMMEMINEED